MKWDTKRRRYVDDKGHVLRAAEVRKHIDDYVTHEQKEIERQSNKLFIGAITLPAFFSFLRQKIGSWHSIAGVIAYGGESQMDSERWSRINAKILSEIAYLDGFERAAEASFAAAETLATTAVVNLAEKIPAGLELLVEERVAEALLKAAPFEAEAVIRATIKDVLADSVGVEKASVIAQGVQVDKAGAMMESLIGGTIPSRSQMYADAAFSTYENNVAQREADFGVTLARRVCEEDEQSCDECVQAASDDYMSLAEVSDIGTLQCLNNCRCFYEFSYEGVEPVRIDETVNAIFARR